MSTIDTPIHEQDASIWPSAIKWGLISGLIGIVMTMLFYNLGLMEQGNIMNSIITTGAMLALGFAIIFLGLKSYRNDSNNGQLSLGKGILWTLGYGLITALIGIVFSYIFFSLLAPDFIENAMALQLAEMEEQGKGDDEMEAATSMMGIFMNPISFAIFGALAQLFYALIEGLVASLILKTR